MVKYEYYLKVWGGFYDSNTAKKENLKSGDYWFDTFEDRENYINMLENFNLGTLSRKLSEGYDTRIKTVCHRVVKFKDSNEELYSFNDLGYCFPIEVAKYIMEWKWTPGCNDYGAIDDDKYLDDIEIISEWITGSYNEKREP